MKEEKKRERNVERKRGTALGDEFLGHEASEAVSGIVLE
jgi:hypothetical protein